ncbi:hypothetical protein I6F26_04530 [Ensifer sp. IC3342]|nr:hypothetical protein [Ensifer sp. BRP08]MCA1445857.1 hypothetical protein [Ensifer sp. IC3342]
MPANFLTAIAIAALLAISSGCTTTGADNTTYAQSQGVDPDIDPSSTSNDTFN